MKDYMVASEEIKEQTEATQPSPSPRLKRSLQVSEENLLASASSFQSQNLSGTEKKKDKSKKKVKKKEIKKKVKGSKKKSKGSKATPVAADKAKDTLIRSGSGQKPPESLRKTMSVAAVQERVAFHIKWGCTKCAWKRCTPSCWKSKNMKVP